VDAYGRESGICIPVKQLDEGTQPVTENVGRVK